MRAKFFMNDALKNYILSEKTIAEIIVDFKALFPQFVAYPDNVLEIYIDLNFYLVPAGLIEIGFNHTYKTYLYALAHLLTMLDVQPDNNTSDADDRLADKMTAGDLSISYRELSEKGGLADWEYFFGSTGYGKTVLLFLKTAGFGASWGCYVV